MEEQFTALQQFVNTLINALTEFFVHYSFQVVGAIIVFAIGFAVARWVSDLILKMSEKKGLDITLSKFLAGAVRITILAFAVLIALGKFGITITPFVAALGALAFGSSFAIAGPLSNYGAGLSIILSRPFAVGNTISVAGVSGVVQDIRLACTILMNEDGVKITIPNRKVVGEILHNSATNSIVESVVGISYDSDPETAIRTVRDVIGKFGQVVKDPAPHVGIQAFGDSSINIGFRYWVPTVKYFDTSYAVNLAIYKALQNAKITIPFPQRDVRIIKGDLK